MDDAVLKRLADPLQYSRDELRSLAANDGILSDVVRYFAGRRNDIDRRHRYTVFRDIVEHAKDRAREAYAKSVDRLLDPVSYAPEILRDTLQSGGYSAAQGLTDYVRENPVPHQKQLLDDLGAFAFVEKSDLAAWLRGQKRETEWNEYRDAERSWKAAYQTGENPSGLAAPHAGEPISPEAPKRHRRRRSTLGR